MELGTVVRTIRDLSLLVWAERGRRVVRNGNCKSLWGVEIDCCAAVLVPILYINPLDAMISTERKQPLRNYGPKISAV